MDYPEKFSQHRDVLYAIGIMPEDCVFKTLSSQKNDEHTTIDYVEGIEALEMLRSECIGSSDHERIGYVSQQLHKTVEYAQVTKMYESCPGRITQTIVEEINPKTVGCCIIS